MWDFLKIASFIGIILFGIGTLRSIIGNILVARSGSGPSMEVSKSFWWSVCPLATCIVIFFTHKLGLGLLVGAGIFFGFAFVVFPIVGMIIGSSEQKRYVKRIDE